MIKKALTTVGLLIGCIVSAHAAWETQDVLFSSCTTNIVSVSSTSATPAATPLFSASLNGATTSFLNVMYDRSYLSVQNIDTSTFTWVLCQVGLSSTSANGDLSLTQPGNLSTTSGRMIRPQGAEPLVYRLPAKDRTFRTMIPWCVNNGGVGAAKVAVTQCKNL